MFHKHTGQILVVLMLSGVSLQPMISHASEPIAPAVPPEAEALQAEPQPGTAEIVVSSVNDFSLIEFRREAKTKLSETQHWVKDNTPQRVLQSDLKGSLKTLDRKIDRLQSRVKPAGRSIKTTWKNKAPGKGLVQIGERKFSVFGLMLMMAFGIVVFLMSAANPTSRLGGRH